MKLLFKPYFILLSLAYLITRFLKSTDLILPYFIKNYFTDLLCMPIILTLCLAFVRFIKRLPSFTLSPFMVISMTVFYAVLFEYILPINNSSQTADWVDVLMYALGGIGYWFIQEKLFKFELNR